MLVGGCLWVCHCVCWWVGVCGCVTVCVGGCVSVGVSLCMLVCVCLWVCHCVCWWVCVCGCFTVYVGGWVSVSVLYIAQRNWLWTVPRTFCHPDALCAGMPTPSKDSIVISNRENLASDCFQGCFVVTCTLCAFISLVWLREQILHGGGPDWLEQDNQAANQARVRRTESEKVIWEE